MTSDPLRFVAVSVLLLVVGYEIFWATRTFGMAKGQRPALALEILPLSYAIVIHKVFRTPVQPWLAIPGIAVLAGSLSLYEWARRSIRGKFFSLASSHDTPEFLWTGGPFAYIRNPFYASYLLSYAGAAIIFPTVTTLAVFVVMIAFYQTVARSEELKFQRSALSREYAAYRQRTGRFIPKV
jgi:protein-S-isoprenylcysteine O-methyltransferase Ste14